MTSTLDAALAYAQRGWRVIPIPPGMKHPNLPRWQELATTDELDLMSWWSNKWTLWGYGIGIATGAASGIFVLDVDDDGGAHRGSDTLADLEATYGPLPETYEVLTPRGGRHLYFQRPAGPLTSPVGVRRVRPDWSVRRPRPEPPGAETECGARSSPPGPRGARATRRGSGASRPPAPRAPPARGAGTHGGLRQS